MNHFVVYDTLSLIARLEKKLLDVSSDELQLFSYLACLLSVYDGLDSNKWGYRFSHTKLGAPYNEGFRLSLNALVLKKLLICKGNDYFQTTEAGLEKLSTLSNMSIYAGRERYLEASAQSIKFVPYGDVRSALLEEPTLKHAQGLDASHVLLDSESASIEFLYEQFELLKTALNSKYKNLVIPALVWMSKNAGQQFG